MSDANNVTPLPVPQPIEVAPASPPAVPAPAAANPPAGWYDDGHGRQRWYDGTGWTDQYAPVAQQPQHTAGPMTAQQLNVKREVSYVRQQKGHSIILHLLISPFLLFINLIYITASPNHYWHA